METGSGPPGERTNAQGAPIRRYAAWALRFGAVLTGKAAFAAASFATLALVGRWLAPEQFGQFTLLRTLMLLAAGLVGPALDTAMVRFMAQGSAARAPADAFLAAALRVKLALGVLLIALAMTFGDAVAASLFPRDSQPSRLLVVVACAGGGVLMLFEWYRSVLQARTHFGRYALYDAAHAVFRLPLVVVLGAAGCLSTLTGLLAFAAMPAVLGAWGLAAEIRSGTVWTRTSREALRALVGFAPWGVAACLFTSVAQAADLLLLGWWNADASALGQYSAARTFMLVADLAVVSWFTLLLPRFSAWPGPKARGRMLWLNGGLAVAAALAAAPGLALCGPVVRWCFGDSYGPAASLLAALLAGTLASLPGAPGGAMLYATDRPQTVAMLEGLKCALTVAAGSWAAYAFGVAGMAWTVAVVKGTIGLLTFGAARRAAADA